MNKSRQLTFAPFVAAASVLWIVAAATGSQGYTTIIGLLAIASLFFHRPDFRFPLYGWVLVAALIWISLTSLWSPASSDLFSGSVTGEDFAIDFASLRLIGVAVFSMLTIDAALRIPASQAEKSNTATLAAIAVMTGLIILVVVLRQKILSMAYPGEPEKAFGEGIQNLQRAANSVAVLLPVGIVAGWQIFTSERSRLVILTISAAALISFQLLGSQSAVLSTLLAFAGLAFVNLLPVTGLKVLLRLIAGYVLLAPVLMWGAIKFVAGTGLRLPESFQARIYGWQETIGKVIERPITGHGLESSGTWRATYADRPDWLEHMTSLASTGQAEAMNKAWQHYPIVPGHPHNMPLELWAETGAIGALLIAATIWLASARLPDQTDENRLFTNTSAALVGAALPLFSFAYSAWNEAYWGMLATAVCVIILLSKRAVR